MAGELVDVTADLCFDAVGEPRVVVQPVVGDPELAQPEVNVERIHVARISVSPHSGDRLVRGLLLARQQPHHCLGRRAAVTAELVEHGLELRVLRNRPQLAR